MKNSIHSLKSNKTFIQIFTFTFLFAITSALSFVQFAIQHKEFMIQYDSIAEYLTVLIYWGQYLREFFHNLFVNHSFILPQWDFSIGLGADILTTLHWYIIGEPLNLLSVFFKPEKTVYLYNFLLFIRLYLSGISFIIYCNSKNFERFYSVLGAIVYIFCGWIFFVGVRHIYFITPMIYLPLMFLGIDKILNDEKPLLFISVTAIACLSNFYFFYILTLLCFFYAVIRFFAVFKNNLFKNFFLYAGKTAVFYLIGLAIGAVIFFPNVASFLLTNRSSMKVPVPLFYEAKYYLLMFLSLIAPKMFENYTLMGFSAITLPVLILALRKKENKSYLAVFFLFIFFLIFPFFGHMFNGFNYITNRWCFAISFIAAILVTVNIKQLCALKGKEIFINLGLPALLGIGVILLSLVSAKFREVFLVSYIALFFVCIGLFVINKFNFNERQKKVFLTILVILSVSANANLRFSKKGYNFLHDFISKGTPNELIFNTIDAKLDEILDGDKDFFRYEQSGKTLLNNAILFGTKANQFYWSENSDEVMSFLGELAVTNSGNQKLTSLGKRAALLALLNTKYLFLHEDQKSPYGFEEFKKYEVNGKNYIIYKNKYSLPFGFSYDKFILKEKFMELDFAQRSSALMKYAVVGDNKIPSSLFSNEAVTEAIVRNNFSVEYEPSIERNDPDFKVKKANSKIKIEFDAIPDAENYLLIDGISYNKDYYDTDIKIYQNGEFLRWMGLDPKYWQWGHKHLILLENLNDGKNCIELEFAEKGNYTIEKIEIVSQKTGNIPDYITNLTEEKLEDLSFEANTISGKISVSKPKVLCMSVPYSKGWKVFVNGKKTDLQNVQLIYSGIFLEPGEYEIKLEYHTPYLLLGALASFTGIAILIIMIFSYRRRNKQG